MRSDTLIFIPTFNEKENVLELCNRILALNLRTDILFLDDNSPDKTGELLDDIRSKHESVYVIHRQEKLGIGSAHKDGMAWAYKQGYKTLITMDCDFTHPPERIPDLLVKAQDHHNDIVVGSRYLKKSSLEEWNLLRKTLTIAGHLMTKVLLKIDYDATGAFRLYKLDKIPGSVFQLAQSNGYSFFFESLFVLNLNKFRIDEVPIDLPRRTYGHSKMKFSDAWHSLSFLARIYFKLKLSKDAYLIKRPKPKEDVKGIQLEWDEYWGSKNGASNKIYDLIASFYRHFIIKRSLNKFINKYFESHSKLLHAGCGGGQVDVDIRNYVSITALDISENALKLYKKTNRKVGELLHASIFDIPLSDQSIDGIYNLGVMEHFTEKEIEIILGEFNRVLKPNGKIILFWPPEYGSSVLFFKFLERILNMIGKNIKLFPDEITRIKSKKHSKMLLEKGNFNMTGYYFGPRDLFTHTVLIGTKNNAKFFD